MFAILSFSAQAAEVTGYVVLTTDYVFRGVSYSDSDPAAQLGVDVSFDSGIFLGAWGSTIDISNPPFSERDREVIYYIGYNHIVSSNWTIGANYVAYRYPASDGLFDYDYDEYMLTANYRDRAWFEYARSPDLYSSGYTTDNYRAHVEWPMPHLITGSAGLGYYDVSGLTGEGYSYWELGIMRPFGVVDLDLRYHDTNQWVPIISSPERADSRIVFSIRFQF
jgi:uncharacterized protein (TIGR02001 family)